MARRKRNVSDLPYAAPPLSCAAFFFKVQNGCATRVNSGTEKGVRESVPPPLRLFLCPKGEDSHHQFCLQPFPNVVVYAEIDVPALVVQLPHGEAGYVAAKAVQDNKPFIMNVYHSVSREQVENYLYKVTYDLLEGVVEEQAQGMSVRDEDKAFIATVYKYAFVGLMLDWIKNDMKGDSQLLVDRLELVIHGNVRAALERLRIDKA